MFILTLLDILISSLVVTPLVVAFWRGTWSYLHYSQICPISWSTYVSTFLLLAFTIIREPLYESRVPGPLGFLLSRLYIYVYAIIGIIQWRGVFSLIDELMPPLVVYTASIISLLILVSIKGISSILGIPYCLFLDHRQKDIFIYPTMFQIDSMESVWLYLLDCAFSVCVIGTLVVFVWRGTWSLLDSFLWPESYVFSSWASVGIGYTIVGLTFLLQPPMKYLAKTLSGIPRVLVVDLYLLFSFCGTVNVWRGVWNILDVYFFPGNPVLSYSLTHFIPFLLLVLINSSNSILVRGVYIDGDEAGSQCVDFPCYYLRLFFQTKRKEKLLKEAAKRQTGRRSEGEILVIPMDSEWKKGADPDSPESHQLINSP